MLLRALAATSAEGWEEEDEKLRSRVDDRIKNVVDDGQGPLKQPALPSTFGSFLGAQGSVFGTSDARRAEDAKDRGKEESERTKKRERGKKDEGRVGNRPTRHREGGTLRKNLVPCSLFRPNLAQLRAQRNRNPKQQPQR